MRTKPSTGQTIVYKVEFLGNYPIVNWTDSLNYPRTVRDCYRKGSDGFYCGSRLEKRAEIIKELASLQWEHGKDRLDMPAMARQSERVRIKRDSAGIHI
jgi:hypothetical protein